MKKGLLLSLTCLAFINLTAQSTLKFEGRLIVDNDIFTGDRASDEYYSSGIYPAFRYLKDSINQTKVIRTYQLNHQIYTPGYIRASSIEQMDRPFAGILSASVANEYYFRKSNSYLKAELEIGWLGPKALVKEAQTAYHRLFGMPKPLGWSYQIQDSPVIDVKIQHIKTLHSSSFIEMAIESNLNMGTVYNNIRAHLMMRAGSLKPLYKSAYTGSSLGILRERKGLKKCIESYFFYSPGMEYVLYNATLQGNLIGKESPYTVAATKWVWQHRLGVMFSWEVFDLGVIGYWRKKENAEATNHNYVGIRLCQRF